MCVKGLFPVSRSRDQAPEAPETGWILLTRWSCSLCLQQATRMCTIHHERVVTAVHGGVCLSVIAACCQWFPLWGWGWGRGSWCLCPPDASCRNVSLGRKPTGEKCVLCFHRGEISKPAVQLLCTPPPTPPLPHSPHTLHPSSFSSRECAPWRYVELWVLVCRTLRFTSLKSKRQIKESFSGKGRSRIK